MQIDVSGAMKNPGVPQSVQLSGQLNPVEYSGQELTFSTIELSASMTFTGETLVFKGSFETLWRTECARCLEEVEVPLSISIEEEYAKEEDEAHPDRIIFRGDIIDLDEMIEMNLILNLPHRVVCSEECKGLCPVCGVNRNEQTCTCRTEAGGAFASLAAWDNPLEDDKEV